MTPAPGATRPCSGIVGMVADGCHAFAPIADGEAGAVDRGGLATRQIESISLKEKLSLK